MKKNRRFVVPLVLGAVLIIPAVARSASQGAYDGVPAIDAALLIVAGMWLGATLVAVVKRLRRPRADED